MTAIATRDLSVGATPASEILANCIQALSASCGGIAGDFSLGDANRFALNSLDDSLRQALVKTQELEAAHAVAVELLRDKEKERIALVDELREFRDLWTDLSSLGVHVYTDWNRQEYVVARRYERRILVTDQWHQAAQLLRELRALETALTENTQQPRLAAGGD